MVVSKDGTIGVVEFTWLEDESVNRLDNLNDLSDVWNSATNVTSSAEEWWDNIVEFQELNEILKFSSVEGRLESVVEKLQVEWLALDDENTGKVLADELSLHG